MLDQPNVEIVDVSKNEIKAFDETGIILEDGTHYDLDAVAIATGFVSLCFMCYTSIRLTDHCSLGYHNRRHDADGIEVHQLD